MLAVIWKKAGDITQGQGTRSDLFLWPQYLGLCLSPSRPLLWNLILREEELPKLLIISGMGLAQERTHPQERATKWSSILSYHLLCPRWITRNGSCPLKVGTLAVRPSWGHRHIQQQMDHSTLDDPRWVTFGLVPLCSTLDPYTCNSQSMHQSAPQHLRKLTGVLQDILKFDGKIARFNICQIRWALAPRNSPFQH